MFSSKTVRNDRLTRQCAGTSRIGSTAAGHGLEAGQAAFRLTNRGFALRKAEPDQRRPVAGVRVETAPRNRRHADFANEVTRELDIVGEPKARDVGHEVVRAAWSETDKAVPFQDANES